MKKISRIKFTTLALSLLSSSSKGNLIRLTRLAEKIPQKTSYREKIGWIRELFKKDHPALEIARRILRESNPKQREKQTQSSHSTYYPLTSFRWRLRKNQGGIACQEPRS